MILEEKNGVFMIIPEEGESFWAYDPIDIHKALTSRPKIRTVLKDWLDVTAPGQWTTSYLEKFRKAIVVRDKATFLLFKLAWTGKDEIRRAQAQRGEAAMFYAPYVPQNLPQVTWASNDVV